jgi:hypothetical protein
MFMIMRAHDTEVAVSLFVGGIIMRKCVALHCVIGALLIGGAPGRADQLNQRPADGEMAAAVRREISIRLPHLVESIVVESRNDRIILSGTVDLFVNKQIATDAAG